MWDGGSLWTALSHRQSHTRVGSPRKQAGIDLETCWVHLCTRALPCFPCPGSPAFFKNFTSKVSGALGPTGCTEHSPPPEARLWKYISSFLCAQGMDSGSRTSSGDGGSGLEAMAVRVWLALGSGALHSQDRAKARPALKTREAKFQFRFPGGPSLFPAEPPPLLLCHLPGPSLGE